LNTENQVEATQHKIKVNTADLRVGMYVCELDRPWLDSPFLLQGFPLQTESDIEDVQQTCDYVYVNTRLSQPGSVSARRAPPADTKTATDAKPAPTKKAGFFTRLIARKRKTSPIVHEVVQPISASRTAFDDTASLVRTVFDDIRLGKSIDTPQAKEAVSKCVEHVIENADAMLLLTSIKNKDNYTAEHSLNVAVLSIILGKQLGMERNKLEEVGLCGMLHDVGKILTPNEVLTKPGRLTPEEMLIMKMHPTQGRDILNNSHGTLPASLDVTHGHHERLDGSGYPRGLDDSQIGIYTRIVTISDVFDAITSNRVYDTRRPNIEAFKILQSQSGNHFDSDLVSVLMKAVGVFSPGTVVKLNNGEIAVVVRTNPARRLLPKVMVLKNAKLKPVTPRYIDLASAHDRGDNGLRIAVSVKADEVGVDTHMFHSAEFLRQLAN
jgi:HD-GYP domain-containing protein (c-di-GMP phosphodiesterase class II)